MASCKPKNDCNCRLSTSTLKSNYGCFLNPAFEDIEIADLHFPNEDSKTHLTKLDTISESGLSYASIPHEISYDNDMYPLDAMSDEVRSFNVTVTPPKRIEKNNKIKVCKYSLWFCIWCVIVVSLAGIVATVACIVWLETYRDQYAVMPINTSQLISDSQTEDLISYSTEQIIEDLETNAV